MLDVLCLGHLVFFFFFFTLFASSVCLCAGSLQVRSLLATILKNVNGWVTFPGRNSAFTPWQLVKAPADSQQPECTSRWRQDIYYHVISVPGIDDFQICSISKEFEGNF